MMGTVEPVYEGLDPNLESLAFIQGAIKKYGNDPGCAEELQEYIIHVAKYIVEDSLKSN